MERLDKFLCDSGAGTRSQVKNMIKSGCVTVDGKVQKDAGAKIDPPLQRPGGDSGQQPLCHAMPLLLPQTRMGQWSISAADNR